MKKSIKMSLIILLCALVCLPSVAYAWISFVFPFSYTQYSTGELSPQTQLYFWDANSAETNKWTQVAQSGTFVPNFGTIDNLAGLPANTNVYLKIKVNDTTNAVYKWRATITNINIKVYDSNNDEIVASGQNNIGSINYYDTSQRCLYYNMGAGANNLVPTAITYGADIGIDSTGHIINDGFLSKDTWLYVNMRLSLPQLQNILRCIPIDKSPYTVRFNLTIEGEGRTVE